MPGGDGPGSRLKPRLPAVNLQYSVFGPALPWPLSVSTSIPYHSFAMTDPPAVQSDLVLTLREEFRSHLETFYSRLKLAPPYESVEKAIRVADDGSARPAERPTGSSCARYGAEMGSVPPGVRNVRTRQETSRHHCRLGAEQRGSRAARRVRPFSRPVHLKLPWTYLRRRSSSHPRRLSVRRTLEQNDCSPADRRA